MCFALKLLFFLRTATIVARGEYEKAFRCIEFGVARNKEYLHGVKTFLRC
jgi:hypothetical protein